MNKLTFISALVTALLLMTACACAKPFICGDYEYSLLEDGMGGNHEVYRERRSPCCSR